MVPQGRRGKSVLSLVGLLTLLVALLTGCTGIGIGGTAGSGTVKTETRQVSGFSRVSFSGVGALNVTQTGKESLTISAEDNLLPLLTSTVSGDTLTLGVKPGDSIRPTKSIVYTLTVAKLDGVSLSGAGSISAQGIKTTALSVRLSGAGSMTMGGSAQSQTVELSGLGSYQAKGFQTASTDVTISGAGSATVSASQTLNAVVSGAGSVTYYGSPQVTKSVSGVGSVKQGQ
ncbi:MAG TPA: head GIN domain-containing protein [Ktedonobacterales bacterium]|nr:head GIN domain-containing protein [Ktedonobacterales bacterium]